MSNVLDSAILVGKESTYGTPATLTRAFEGKADSFKRQQDPLESVGFRADMQAKRADRRTMVNMGGAGELAFDIQNKGFGLLLQAMLGSISGPTQQAATTAYKSTAQTTTLDPQDSFTVQVQRPDMGGTTRNFTHHGAVVTGWSITQELDAYAMATLQFDFEDVDTVTGAGTPTYPASTTPFDWTQLVVSLDSTDTDVTSFSLDADLALKTDRRFLRGSELKKQPCRSGVPVFTGQLAAEFEDLTLYNQFVAGTTVPLVATWTGATIESPYPYELKITCAAVQYTGESPEVSLSEVPTQAIPFEVLWDGTNPAVEITYQSTDTTL